MNLLYKKNQNRKRSLLLKQLLIFALLVAVIYPLSKSFYRNYQKNKEIEDDINDFRNQVTEIEEKKFELRKYLDYAKSDEFIDKQARLSLNFKKEGEEVFVVKREEGTGDRDQKKEILNRYGVINAKVEASTQSNFFRWKDYFFGEW